ncbi:MAG: cytochrome C oxidase subunit IV family protein [Chloroflexia bacterium]|nr:cytochrome C oxidase subunit IV family protein [Chloroflexia bacterium]
MAHDSSVMQAGPGTKPGSDHAVDQHEEHPGERVYINVAIILAVVTLLEVVIYYVDAISGILVPTLIIMSLAKFVTVVGYFMHLKYDDRRFSYIFSAGLITAVAVFVAVAVMQAYEHVVEFFTAASPF